MKKALLSGMILIFFVASISAQQQVPNGGFENWTDSGLGYEDPDGWDTPNESTLVTGVFTVTKSDTVSTGNYSAKLKSRLLVGEYVSPGVVTLGEFVVDFLTQTATFEGGIPFTDKPIALKGDFKNFPAANDSTIVMAIFTEYLEAKGKTDTIGLGIMYANDVVADWTSFSVPISFFNDHDPDTMNIIVVSSNMFSPNKDSYMFIDNFAFEYEAGIDDLENIVETNIFPNPASDKISFTFGKKINANLNIYSNDGQQVYSGIVNGTDQTIDVSNFAAGAFYFGVFEKNKKISSGQFVISR